MTCPRDWWDLDNYTNPPLLPEVFQDINSVVPSHTQWFRAFKLTPFDKVKVVIIGQDPYPTPGHANGLAFSVNPSVNTLPPSLRNIFQEYRSDLGFPQPRNGDLTRWAANGVLLLNTCLTTEAGVRGAHLGMGWEALTEEAIKKLVEYRENIVFILWGSHAHQYHPLIPSKTHHVIRSPHPSPLSASRGFFGSRPFSRANEYLVSKKKEPVNWRL